MMDRQHDLSLTRQSSLLGISRGSYYYQPRPVSKTDLALMRRMDELHMDYPFAGSRMLKGLLRQEGFTVGRLHVATLMKTMGIEAIYRRPNTSKPHPEHKIYPYLLRNMAVTRPNQVWAMDITYVPMRRGFVYLDKPSDGLADKTRKIHDDYIHDFVFDNGRIQNIYLLDKKNITRNKLQVIKQFEQSGTHANRYDVTLLANGLPLVQIELKKRGVAIREAFNQIHRYSKESLNSEHSLYKYLQVFVISNGTDTRYFANTVKRDKNSLSDVSTSETELGI